MAGAISRASWSPDGRRFVFVQNRPRLRRVDLVVAAPSGRVVRRLGSAGEYPREDPAWSPDGRWIAQMAGGRGGALGVVPARGGRWRWLATTRTLDAGFESPTWTADSRRIAYSISPAGIPLASGIYTVALEGGEPELLVRDAQKPAFSPDGSKLAYVLGGDVFVSDADGTNARRITTTAAPENRPAWSSDGRLLAFTRMIGSRSVIVVARRDGTGSRIAVSSRRYDALLPSWRPAARWPGARRPACP